MASFAALTLPKHFIDGMSSQQLHELQQQIEARQVSIAAAIAAKTFAIPEVLENILVNLEMFEVFNAMRVNKTFRDTIAASHKLCKSVFMIYQPELRFTNDGLPIMNPSIPHALNALGFDLVSSGYQDGATKMLELTSLRPRAPGRYPDEAFAGFQNAVDEFMQVKGGSESWRLTKITAFPLTVRIGFGPDGPSTYFESSRGSNGVMFFEVQGQEATLGKLWELTMCAWMRSLQVEQQLWGKRRRVLPACFGPGPFAAS